MVKQEQEQVRADLEKFKRLKQFHELNIQSNFAEMERIRRELDSVRLERSQLVAKARAPPKDAYFRLVINNLFEVATFYKTQFEQAVQYQRGTIDAEGLSNNLKLEQIKGQVRDLFKDN